MGTGKNKGNLLCELVPEARAFFDFEKNEGIDFDLLTVWSRTKCHWKCPECGVETYQAVRSKSRKETDGSYGFFGCNNHNKLFDLVPEAKSFYDFEKNKDIDSSSLSVASGKKVWWKCPDCGAETYLSVFSKVDKLPDGSYRFWGCNKHSKLFDLVPKAKLFYDFEKNKDIDASSLSVASTKEIWWRCPDCGTETYQTVNSKVNKLSDGSYRFCGCKCQSYYPSHKKRKNTISSRTISDTDCLSRIWDCTNTLDPDNLFANSDVRAKWVCPKCGYKWIASVRRVDRYRGRCPACDSRHIIVPGSTDVFSLAPDAERYYDWDKNVDIDIEHLGVSSRTKVYWRCPDCGNETYTAIANKIHKHPDGLYYVSGCNKCFGKRNEKQANANIGSCSIAENENLMRFWDYNANKDIDPAALGVYSKRTVSWKCPKCGYSWRSSIHNLRRFKGECPSCSKHCVSENEYLMKLWDWDSNKELDPTTLNVYSRQAVSWKCQKCGYTWTSSINSLRNSKGECPCCDLHRVVVLGVNDVFSRVPDAKEYYDFEKNADIDIAKIGVSSRRKAWWKCPVCGDEEFASFSSKIKKHDGVYHFGACKKCYKGNAQKRKYFGEYTDLGSRSLSSQHPEVAQLWSANNERSANTVTPDCSFNALWGCPECNGEYRALVHDVVYGTASCPVCSNKRILPGYNTLADKNPDIAEIWSTNNRLRPTDIFPTSSFVALWSCPYCGGEFVAPVKDMVKKVVECPYCTARRPLSGYNTLADKYPELATMWSADNDLGADSVLPDSSYEARWVCPNCNGKYDAPIRDMVNNTIECPFCSNKKALPGFNSLAVQYPSIAHEWDTIKNYAIGMNPDSILPTNTTPVWWICEKGHKYRTSAKNRVLANKRHQVACRCCKGHRRGKRHFV